MGRYELPGITSLGEALVLRPNGGAIAVFAPSGLSIHNAAAILDEALIEAMLDPQVETLGEAAVQALTAYAANEEVEFDHMLRIYHLLGDPALRIEAHDGPAPGSIFQDGFESGGVDAWFSSVP